MRFCTPIALLHYENSNLSSWSSIFLYIWSVLIFYTLDICSESDNVPGEEVNDWGGEPATVEPTEEPKDDNKETEYVLH